MSEADFSGAIAEIPRACTSSGDTILATSHPVKDHTTSVNRSFSDLDVGRFAIASAALCGARTALQHPMSIALTRKQTCTVAASMSTAQILMHMFRHEGGVSSMQCGFATMVAGCAVSEVIYLVLIEALREGLPFESDVARDAGAAYTADVASRLIYLPLSIVAARQIAFASSLSSMANVGAADGRSSRVLPNAATVLRGMYAEGGIRSVFCGLGVTLAIGSQYSALWWALYNQVKAAGYAAANPLLSDDDPGDASWHNALMSRDDNVVVNTVASVVTSATAAFVFNPFFVLRINMQLAVKGTVTKTFKSLYQKGGWRAFFQGVYLNMTASVIDGVLASTSYEYAKIFADRSKKHII